MQAAAQEWVDSSISKTINCPEDISFEDFADVYLKAWDLAARAARLSSQRRHGIRAL
ncbi:hypothetical protein PHISP_08831, partial [Aspergillus sp. HF37]